MAADLHGPRPPGRMYWMLVSASGLSNLADGLFKMALPLVAIVFTRSPAVVAGLEVVRMLPWLVGALPVGASTDRIDRRKSMLWANTARGSLTLGAGTILATGNGSIWLLYGAALTIGIAEVFYDTAAQTMLPSIVPRSQLDRANGRLFAVELGAQELLGPPLAGLLVALSASLLFYSSATAWVVAIGILSSIRGTFRPPRNEISTASMWSDVKEGLAFIWNRRVLRAMAIMAALATVALGAAFSVLVLFVVGENSPMGLTEGYFVVVFTAMAVGGVVGAVFAEKTAHRIGRSRAITLAIIGLVVAIASPAVTTNLYAIVIAQFIGGIGNMQWNVITVSYRQRVTPDALLGRVNSSYRLLTWGARPFGAFVGGAIGTLLSIQAVYVTMAILMATLLLPNRLLTETELSRTRG